MEHPDDLLLALFARFAEQGASVDVVLSIHGTLITGALVSYREYIRAMSDGFATARGSQEVARALHTAFARVADTADAVTEADNEDTESPQWLHLRNAAIVQADGALLPTNRALLWRARLESVDGWALGSVERA